MLRKIRCAKCGKFYEMDCPEIPPLFKEVLERMMSRLLCAKCTPPAPVSEQRDLYAERLAKWSRICPPLYLQTDVAKLPDAVSYHTVMRWSFGPKGLVMGGGTGAGKTRTAYCLLRREWLAGRSMEIFTAKAFSRECALMAMESAWAAKKWTHKMATVDILFIDDFGKSDMTDFVQAALFEMIENRVANLKPIILTTNDTKDTLEHRFSGERGEPLMRRLREHCQQVVFKKD